jgi:MFS transporter, SP family, arabinose:H+ symporter
VGSGTGVWLLIREIFLNRSRATGQALGNSALWVIAALLMLFCQISTERMAPKTILAFFCFMMFLQFLWVRFMMHETKGVSLEQMRQEFLHPEKCQTAPERIGTWLI